MEDQLTSIWGKAQMYHQAHLSIHGDPMQVARVVSAQSLVAHIHQLEANHLHSSAFEWTDDLITQLHSFSSIISLLGQGNPAISALVRTPLAVVIQLVSRYQGVLDLIGQVYNQFDVALPQIESYLKDFGNRALPARLQDNLVVYYAELIGQYNDTVRFLQEKKRILIFSSHTSKFCRSTEKRLSILKETKKIIEEEINRFQFRIHQEQHHATYSLMKRLEANQELTMGFQFPGKYFQHRRNGRFNFRDRILEQLRIHVRQHSSSEFRAASLQGLGGVGKTQIALEFAHRYSDDYDAIIWINAETEAKLRESLCAYVSTGQNEPPAFLEQNSVLINNIRKHLKTGTNAQGKPLRWLAIYDNVEDAQLIDKFWLEGSHGSVILTTRSPEIAHDFGSLPISVPLFTDEESLSFMLSMNTHADSSLKEEVEVARDIAKRAGHLPLVLNFISAYCRSTCSSYRSFIQHYRDFDTKMLFQYDNGKGLSYERSICNTWTMTLASIDPLARMLMETLVLLDTDGVPSELFECHDANAKFIYNGPDEDFPRFQECQLERFPDRQTLDKAISTLSVKGLVTRSSGSERISCHRMIREAVLQSLAEEDRELHFDWIVFCLNGCFPRNHSGASMSNSWDRCAIFHPQISMLLKTYKRFSNSLRPPILLCEIVRRCAWYLQERGNFQAAKEMLLASFEILETAVEESDYPGYFPEYIWRLTAELYSTHGSIEYEQNLPGHGRIWFQKADEHRMSLIEEDRTEPYDLPNMALVDGNISLSYLADGLPDPSIATYTMILNTFDNRDSRGIWAANLSIALRAKGNLEASLSWCQDSSDWYKEIHGEHSLGMAFAHFNTASTLLALRRDDDAMIALEECLKIRQEKSPMHRYLGFTQHKIGLLMKSRGDLKRAELFLRSAINVLEKCESCEGAAARSKFALLTVIEDTEEACSLAGDIAQSLEAFEETVDRNLWDGDYFDKFVVYCHR